YNHPSTTTVTLFYRTVPILPETNGRVAEIFIGTSANVGQGEPIFRLDNTKQTAALETAKRKIAEVDAAFVVAKSDVVKADGQLQQAKGALQQANDELETKQELYRRNPGNVAFREIEKLQVAVTANEGAVAAAVASKDSADLRVTTVLPAERSSAEAQLAQAQVDLDKTTIRAGTSGRVEQVFL